MKYAHGRLAKHRSVEASRAGPTSGWLFRRPFSFEVLEDRRLLSAVPNDQSVAELASVPVAEPMVRPLRLFSASPSATAGPDNGLKPAQIRHAYGFDQITLNGGVVGDGAGQTIAIIDAFHNPNMDDNLAGFDAQFGIPAPPSFLRVSQTGSTTLPTTTNAGWAVETALDVEWAHALAPGANIILVEANSANSNDLFAGVNWARQQPGVVAISMSWGFAESLMTASQESGFDATFTTPSGRDGVTFLGASGDNGPPGFYPAISKNVLSVGGTTLSLDTQANNYDYISDAAWAGSGGGESLFEPLQSYQAPFVSGSTTHRAMPDVSFDANPATGVAIYDIFTNGASTPWSAVGGTSFSTPAWAALVAIVSQGRALDGLAPYDGPGGLMPAIYGLPNSDFHDVVLDSNGNATLSGYDEVTGRGTPIANLIVSGLVGSGSISGNVFNDVNGNGVLESEPGLSGWTVYQDANNNSAYDVSTPHTFSNSTAVFLPNNSTRTSVINAALTGVVLDVDVTFDITHSFGNDLSITLTSPTNVKVTLLSRVVGSNGNIQATLDDAAVASIIGGTNDISGTFQPATPLSMFNGINPNGNWTLTVKDNASLNTGTLHSWSLQIRTGDSSTVSSGNGNYQFPGLLAGNYKIGEVLQPSYTRTVPVSGFYNVVLPGTSDVTGQDFGNQLPASAQPSGVSLLPASDTGVSNSDGITKLNNALQFQVTGTVNGATVYVLADNVVVGSATANGSSTTVTTNIGFFDGSHTISATQTELNKSPSIPVAGSPIVVDTQAPVANIVAVTPNPRTSPVGQMTITFAEPVTGLNLADLQLTRDNGSNLLGAQTVTTNDNGLTWTLDSLLAITGAAGFYELDVTLQGTPIVDTAGNAETATPSSTFTVGSTVAGRQLFYNQSTWDGGTDSVTTNDDSAIATDKTAYIAGSGSASSAALSSYTRGINGVMVDLLGGGAHTSIDASDFIFKTGNDNTPSGWATAPAPVLITVRTGAGVNSSDRVEILWGANAVKEAWLEVEVLATSHTGLASTDVFFWGNLIGDSNLNFATTGSDSANVLAHLGGDGSITGPLDHNRSTTVNGTDSSAALANVASLTRINLTAGAFAPVGAGGGGGIVAGPAASTPSGSSPSVATVASVAGSANGLTAGGDHGDARVTFGLSVTATMWRTAGADWDRGDVWSMIDENLVELLALGRRQGSLRRRS